MPPLSSAAGSSAGASAGASAVSVSLPHAASANDAAARRATTRCEDRFMYFSIQVFTRKATSGLHVAERTLKTPNEHDPEEG